MKCFAVAALLLLSGCVTSRQARQVKSAGFLGDSASLLARSGDKDDALLVYHRAGTDWASYDGMVVDTVAIWSTAPSTLLPAELEDYRRVIASFDQTLRTKLAASYAIVEAPRPHALRLQVAIVDGSAADAPLKVVKNVAPYASIADFLWTFATGKPAFTGEVSLEYMIRDSASGELLAAGADRRVGGNQLGAATFTRWGDVKNILTYWSELAVYRLCLDRGATGCQRPRSGIAEP
jgi:Protein of unknown function (DUF3313)